MGLHRVSFQERFRSFTKFEKYFSNPTTPQIIHLDEWISVLYIPAQAHPSLEPLSLPTLLFNILQVLQGLVGVSLSPCPWCRSIAPWLHCSCGTCRIKPCGAIAQRDQLGALCPPRGVGGRRYGDICICIADSLCYTAETNTPLKSNYTPITMLKKKKSFWRGYLCSSRLVSPTLLWWSVLGLGRKRLCPYSHNICALPQHLLFMFWSCQALDKYVLIWT